MRIQHNIMALNAYRQLGGNNSALAKNLEKLSSGYRINRAGDDAAGLAISEKMRAQIKGLEAAQKNANDGISLVQTAEGALTEVHSMLNRMVYLATQSANGTYDNEVDRANLDKEVQTLKEEIDRISKSTNFNGLKLLDGSMDVNASETTGGKTDVPILQDVATDPTKEVGTKTVLHEDAPKPGPTEINVELHNVKVTSKSKEGDKISFKVGDAEVELEIVAKDDADLSAGKLGAGVTYEAKDIATAIEAKFKAGDKLIGGQVFDVKASGNTLKFTQKETPKDKTEVVNANVGVSIDYVENPDGNPKEYTVKIANTALMKGSKIKIGGNEVELTGKLSEHFANEKNQKVGDYEVTYANGTLKIKDPNGTLKTPTVSYDSYETALTQKPSETNSFDKATNGTDATAEIVLGAAPAKGDEITIDGETLTFNGTAWAGGTNYTAAAKGATGDDAKTVVIKRLAAKDAAEANGKTATYTQKASTLKAAINQTAGGDGGGNNATTTFELNAAVRNGDKITIEDQDYVYNAATSTWNGPATGAKYGITATGGDTTGTKWTITAADDAATHNGKTATFTAAAAITATSPEMKDGVSKVDAGDKGNTVFDFSSLEEGDKLIVGSDEYIIGEDGLKGLDAAALAASAGADVGAVTINADEGKITFEAAAATTLTDGSDAPDVAVKVAKKVTKEGEVVTPADTKSMDGTWNVQSTKNKQGAAEGGGQLASTTFDLTTDIVADGNVLTIGDSSYVFKVGKDSTVTSQAGQTLINLEDYEADDPELINKAGALLANQANNAFTIGYEKDSKKISIHEVEGQKAFTNGELESVEEFDKLVYMTAPEKTTSTGKGLTFQVGDTADDFQKVALSIHDMSSEGLGIGDVDIKTIDSAADAIDKIKTAINTVSSQRGDLGAIQNRLEHTINNLGVQTENITAAESRIRDTDMAEEMMAYTKNNILVQAAQAMLAQANQVPQGVLQLLQ